nr:hypothetical protein [Tanacetum cinerariifolium]
MSTDVTRGYGGDGGEDDRLPPYQVPTGCGGCLGNRGKGTQKPNLGGRRAGRLHTRQETRNLELKDGIYDLEGIRRARPSYISEADWDAQLAFWNDPKNLARAAQNKQNRAKSKV